jgi:hypothetical protein
VSGTARRAEGVVVRTVGESPAVPGARAVAPTLEDAYLDCLAQHRTGTS